MVKESVDISNVINKVLGCFGCMTIFGIAETVGFECKSGTCGFY